MYGVRGFVNVKQNAKKIVFAGAFTAGRLNVIVHDGKLVIVQEGKYKKFLKKVDYISFSGQYARQVGQAVLFITERAVFELTHEGMGKEIAPGIDLEKDVLDLMDFKPVISQELKLMPEEIFQPTWGKLRQILEG